MYSLGLKFSVTFLSRAKVFPLASPQTSVGVRLLRIHFSPVGGEMNAWQPNPNGRLWGGYVSLCCDLNFFFQANSAKMAHQHGHNAVLLKKNSNNTVWGYLFWCLDSSGCFKVTVSVIGAVPLYRVLVVQFFSVKPFSWVLTWVLNTLPLLLWSISERKLKRFVNFTRTTSQLLLRK